VLKKNCISDPDLFTDQDPYPEPDIISRSGSAFRITIADLDKNSEEFIGKSLG
jgi:hypothetical protein